jgi:PEP-CTERM motif
MNSRPLCVLPLLLAATATLHASIDYSGIQNVSIPLTLDGVYLRLDTGATASTQPGNFTTTPWLNPFFGGVGIGSSPLVRPIITGTDQILNLAPGTLIDSTSNFLSGPGGSSTHVGPGAGQFALETPGYIGVAFSSSVGGPEYYGWLQVSLDNDSAGRIISWAYENVAGTPIRVAATATSVPEPGTALAGLAVGAVALGRRRRRKE